jgi:hypothetical protein
MFAVTLLCTGCSNQQLYTAAQSNTQNECYKLPSFQYRECMKRSSVSYDRYTKERKEVLSE